MALQYFNTDCRQYKINKLLTSVNYTKSVHYGSLLNTNINIINNK